MEKSDLNKTSKVSPVPLDIKLELCRELALAFRQLCQTVCKRFGREGEQLIRENFLSDSALLEKIAAEGKENHLSKVNTTLIKLLTSWSISSSPENISMGNINHPARENNLLNGDNHKQKELPSYREKGGEKYARKT